jgi:hypothetical protein
MMELLLFSFRIFPVLYCLQIVGCDKSYSDPRCLVYEDSTNGEYRCPIDGTITNQSAQKNALPCCQDPTYAYS